MNHSASQPTFAACAGDGTYGSQTFSLMLRVMNNPGLTAPARRVEVMGSSVSNRFPVEFSDAVCLGRRFS